MDQDAIRLHGVIDILQPSHDSARQLVKGLSMSHQIEIGIGRQVKNVKYLIQHAAVLGCHADQ